MIKIFHHRRELFHQIRNSVDQLGERGEAPAAGMTTMIIIVMAVKKSTTQDSSSNHRGRTIVEGQIAAGMMMEDTAEIQTEEADHLALATVVGMTMIKMMLVDSTHLNPTPTTIYHQETEEEEVVEEIAIEEEEEVEEEIAIEEVGNVVKGVEEEGVEEVEEEEGLMLVKEAEAVTAIPSRVL